MLRKSNIELLRIVSMLLIVLSHACVHSPWTEVASAKQYVINCLSLGEVGVVVFVLITGYFSFESRFKFKSLLRVCLQVSFYSIACYVAVKLMGADGDFARFTLTPVLSGAYWFVTAWVGLYIAMPFLNCIVRSFSRDGLRNALVVMGMSLCVVPIAFEAPFVYSNFLYFVFLYLLGAFFGKWGNPVHHLPFVQRALFVGISWLFLFAMIVLTTRIPALEGFGLTPGYMWSLNSFAILPAGVSLFLLVEPIDMGSIKSVNIVSSAAFGVYLLSDNYLVRPLLWSAVGLANYAGPDVGMMSFVLHMMASVLAVYAVCTLVDLLRLHVLERPLFALFEKPISIADAKVNGFFDFEREGA